MADIAEEFSHTAPTLSKRDGMSLLGLMGLLVFFWYRGALIAFHGAAEYSHRLLNGVHFKNIAPILKTWHSLQNAPGIGLGSAPGRVPVPRVFDPEDLADRLLANEEQADRAADSYRWENADLLAATLPEGEATDAEVNEALEVVLAALESRGSGITKPTLRGWLTVARRNPPEVRNGVSLTAAQEAGDRPERFEWFAEHGASLSKRQVRRLRGDRKIDNPVTSNSSISERQAKVAELLGGMSAAHVEELAQRHPEAARALMRAATAAGTRARQEVDGAEGIRGQQVGDDLAEYIHNADLGLRRRLHAVFTRDEVPEGMRGAVLLALSRLEQSAGWTKAWASGQSGSLISDLETFLSEREA
ncbi:hypothetical protein [Nonomuraea sp. NEAU-A123]|uniref:hypothetical protein n=1 Tax=Nonomuraea sp. NEAU-A123 TaxID=2839649 RepID=UPI001BE3E1F5|nr:hypothetical protein [Nonomuraea sp. NEAU-A123]MBT2235073.1 hypothetical protein [Nonomuraea sp. NEAU-A123]